ncbi:MAG: hypothetical protein ABIQ55_07440 [Gemmatimonadaceae bacterium]
MPDDPSNLPSKTAPLDRSAIERVLARAAELQATSSATDSSGLLSEAELMEIGKEAGISPNTLTQALAEERSRISVIEEKGFVAGITGPGIATASRVVRGAPADVLAAIDNHMQRDECLTLQRRFPDRVLWEPKPGMLGQLQRGLNIGGRGYHLTRASQVAATIIPVDTERVLVRLDADVSHARATRVRTGAAALIVGILGSGVIATLGTLIAAPEAFMLVGGAAAVPTLLGATAGYQVGKGHRQLVMRAQLALEQALDRLEFGSTRRIK